MRIPKVYGESKQNNCPFCDKPALTKNKQKIPVCMYHKTRELCDLKCVCGEWLDLRQGKFGPFFNCMKCGAVNFKKALEVNPNFKECSAGMPKEEKQISAKKTFTPTTNNKKEITITSEECDIYFS